MNDERRIANRGSAVFARQQVSGDDLNLSSRTTARINDRIQAPQITRGSNKAAEITETAIEEALHDPGAYETGSSSYKDGVVRADDEF
jgi:hypothetical protein